MNGVKCLNFDLSIDEILALVTSFGVVKYMVAYSLTQFLTVIMLYTVY